MKPLQLLKIITSFLILTFYTVGVSAQAGSYKGWKAGVARVVITPDQPLWMAGYANRDHPSEGKIVDLWAKALVLQDSVGKQIVLVTADLVGIPKTLSDHIRDELKRRFNLSRSQIAINTSHTHTGPVLTNALVDIYPVDSSQQQKIDEYTNKLEEKIVALVDKALHTMEPVQLYAGNGVTRFQVNRRNNVEATLSSQSDLNGPNDYAVPVIKVENKKGELIAVAFGYACHNTVLAGYKWSGDYAGFAQLDLEKTHPGVTALFLQGCGADQNPLPRRTVQLAQQYGKDLAAAVDRVLDEDMEQLPPHLTTAYGEVELSLNTPPSKEELLKKAAESSDYQKRWASHLLKNINKGETLRTSYPYPVEVWKIGDQPIIILGGEVVVGYAIELKRIFGQNVFVLGYSNDVMSYIPTAKILQEGGYEGVGSQMVYGLPNTWKSNIETVILQKILQVAIEAGIPILSSKIN
ncbi:MAG TPA: neutral/alkaline non-lysosomal ceramidase N-terminal domain-containing protein [Hanamia sp.]